MHAAAASFSNFKPFVFSNCFLGRVQSAHVTRRVIRWYPMRDNSEWGTSVDEVCVFVFLASQFNLPVIFRPSQSWNGGERGYRETKPDNITPRASLICRSGCVLARQSEKDPRRPRTQVQEQWAGILFHTYGIFCCSFSLHFQWIHSSSRTFCCQGRPWQLTESICVNFRPLREKQEKQTSAGRDRQSAKKSHRSAEQRDIRQYFPISGRRQTSAQKKVRPNCP